MESFFHEIGLNFYLLRKVILIALLFFGFKWLLKSFKKTDAESPNIPNDQVPKQEWAASVEKLGKTFVEAYAITSKYGEVLELNSAGLLMDEKLLPYPNEKIKWAIVFRAAWEQTFKDHYLGGPGAKISQAPLANHRQAYKNLGLFVPAEEAAQTQKLLNLIMKGKKTFERIEREGTPVEENEEAKAFMDEFANSEGLGISSSRSMEIAQSGIKLGMEFNVLLKAQLEWCEVLKDSLSTPRPY